MANPYTILTQVPGNTSQFPVLYLKDAFCGVPLDPDPKYLFAFEWEDPDRCLSQQCTWAVVPQGFRDSPRLFAQTLERDCRELSLPDVLQYIDDRLIYSPSQETSLKDTIQTYPSNARGDTKYLPKAKISLQQVTYLGYVLSPGGCQLSQERKEAILDMVLLATWKQYSSWRWQGSVEFGHQTWC